MNRLIMKAWNAAADFIIAKAKPNVFGHIIAGVGVYKTESPDDYMRRYWFFNPYDDETHEAKYSLLPSVRVHNIRKSDDDRAFHDHPWWYLTIILKGGYYEVTPVIKGYNEAVSDDGTIRREYVVVGHRAKWRGPGSILFRRADSWHRLVVPTGGEAWTLFTTGKWQQTWGFLLNDFIKMPYRMYLDLYGHRKEQ